MSIAWIAFVERLSQESRERGQSEPAIVPDGFRECAEVLGVEPGRYLLRLHQNFCKVHQCIKTAMKAKVTEQGLLIPKQFLEGIQEVELRKQQGLLLIVPIVNDDPILQLGREPIVDTVDDASKRSIINS